MKTKLLKKVRKRYEIVKITKFEQEHYFVLNDKEYPNWDYGKLTFDEAIELLIESIKVDYKHTSKRRQTKKEKHWWVK
jgi:hypothetical protein